MAKTNKNDKNKQNLKSSKFCNLQSAVANLQQALPLQMAPYVTDLVKLNVVGYFSQPAEILANLGPGQFRKNPGQILMNLVKN